MSMAQIIICVYIRGGLYGAIDMGLEANPLELDYKGISYRSRRFHKHLKLTKYFLSPLHKKANRTKVSPPVSGTE